MHEAGAMRNRAGLTGSEKLVAAGTAGRTVAVDNAGVKCCNMHANLTGKCALSDVTEDDAEGDNLLDLLADFGCWLAATQVQNSRNTRSTDSPICIATSTKMQHFGKVKEELKRMFPRHACWVSEEWHTKQRDLVKRAADRGSLCDPDILTGVQLVSCCRCHFQESKTIS